MGQHNSTYQQQNTVSIRREKLIDIAVLENLSVDDYRVLLMLFTQLDGFKLPEPGSSNFHNYKDPLNYKSISVEQIADTLNLKKKKVRKSIDLIDSLYLIECGSNETVKNGYRFTF